MSARSVRLDDEAENALDDIIKRTGLSIDDAIKQGLVSYREVLLNTASKKPSDFFNNFDLGQGGDALITGRDSNQLISKKKLSKARLNK